MAKRRQQSGGDIPEWVVTYGDLMSLLLCFFILLAAFSEMKQPREFRKVLEQIQEALGVTGGMGLRPTKDDSANSVISQLAEMAKRDGDKMASDHQNEPNVPGREPRLSTLPEGPLSVLGGTLPFDPGRTEITPQVQAVLKQHVAPQIKDQRYIVHVVGHAWGVEDRRESGLDHTDLSYARARSVVDFLVNECGIDRRILRPVPAADTEPASVSGSGSNENRRVQVFLTQRELSDVHPDPHLTGRAP